MPEAISVSLSDKLLETGLFFVGIMSELVLIFLAVSILVGLLQEYVPASRVRAVLAVGGRGNMVGAGLGALTPFCSCSTIPVLVGLLNAGAPFGSVMSFLLASPLVNPVVLALFWYAFGWQVTVIYSVYAFTIAVLVGILWDRLGLAQHVRNVKVSGGAAAQNDYTDVPFRARLHRAATSAVRYLIGFSPFLLVGAGVGALIHGLVPADWFALLAGPDNPAAVPVSAAIGVPLYVQAATMVPISVALLEKGMSLGAVMALIIGGAGASLPEVTLLSRIFKPRLLMAFLATVFLTAVSAGYAFNLIF